jgi:hypothetical protein
MSRPHPSNLAKQLADRVRDDGENILTRWADIIKDLLLDWDISSEEEEAEPIVDELPRMSEEEFVHALRGKIDETLHRIADAINRAPTGQIIAASEEKVCQFLAELYATALELGVQMRLEAAESQSGKPTKTRPQGEWAKRLRRMMAGGAEMPLGNDPQGRPGVSS